MTPLGPPKRAPEGIPPEAARYLDNAAVYLKPLVEKHGLDLKLYEQYDPEHSSWYHGMYAELNDRDAYLRVMTDEELAPTFTADVIAYVRLHARPGQIVYPKDDFLGDWIIIRRKRVNGMDEMVKTAQAFMRSIRLACFLRLPHPTTPDPKA